MICVYDMKVMVDTHGRFWTRNIVAEPELEIGIDGNQWDETMQQMQQK